MNNPTPKTWDEALDEIVKNCQRSSTNRIDHFKDDTIDSLNRDDIKSALNNAVKEHVIGIDTIEESERWRYTPEYLAKDDLRAEQRKIVDGEQS